MRQVKCFFMDLPGYEKEGVTMGTGDVHENMEWSYESDVDWVHEYYFMDFN